MVSTQNCIDIESCRIISYTVCLVTAIHLQTQYSLGSIRPGRDATKEIFHAHFGPKCAFFYMGPVCFSLALLRVSRTGIHFITQSIQFL